MENHILDYWNSQAVRFGNDHWASWGDRHAIMLEIDNIGKYIQEGQHVLDVGCANGFAALHHVNKGVASIVGVDFSEKMIERALMLKLTEDQKRRLSFRVGDVRRLEFPADSFDVVYTTRVLINLPTWEEQKLGILECLRVCKPGGVFVLSEAFWEPLMLLNALRALKQLPPLVEHDFNRYLKMGLLGEFLREKDLQFEIIDFCSVYYLGSRFLRELVTNASAYPGYSNPINELFYEIEKKFSGGGFGVQQAYVIRK